MKKVLFTTLSIIAVAAMMMVSCKKEPVEKPDDNKEEQKVDEDLVGTWTITGEAYGWDQTKGLAMTESDNVWTAAEVSIKGEGIKFVKDASWDVNLGAKEDGAKEDDVEFELEKGGKNIKGAKDGVYSVTLNLLTKKAKIKFVKDLEPADPTEWDYTPSAEYSAEGNLWKAVDAADNALSYYYYFNPGWAETPIHGDTIADEYPYVTKVQSTYKFNYEPATTERWQNQVFFFPKESNFVGLSKFKKYSFKITFGANKPLNCFFKLETYNPDHAKREGACILEPAGYPDNVKIEKAFVPVIVEGTIENVSCDNLTLVFDFGTSPENVEIYVKDITLVVTESNPAAVLDGQFDEWADVAAFAGAGDRITEWKVKSDDENIYMYFKCPASIVKSRGIWDAYIDGAFDTDNNAETGASASYGLGDGMEAGFVAFPFSNAKGEDVTFLNGEKSDSWIKCPLDAETGKVTSFGALDGDYALVELAIPRNLIGKPASGATIGINVGMGSQPAGKQTVVLN